MSIQGKHILVGISGGIAAYKIPELIRSLVKAGAEVRVATTRHALEFVTELTLQTVSGSRVYSDVFAAINEHATDYQRTRYRAHLPTRLVRCDDRSPCDRQRPLQNGSRNSGRCADDHHLFLRSPQTYRGSACDER